MTSKWCFDLASAGSPSRMIQMRRGKRDDVGWTEWPPPRRPEWPLLETGAAHALLSPSRMETTGARTDREQDRKSRGQNEGQTERRTDRA